MSPNNVRSRSQRMKNECRLPGIQGVLLTKPIQVCDLLEISMFSHFLFDLSGITGYSWISKDVNILKDPGRM